MVDTDSNVQTGTTPAPETTKPAGEVSKPDGGNGATPPETQSLTKEEVTKMISEANATVLAEATEKHKRELQSIKDRSLAEIERAKREAQASRTALGQARTRIKETDPDILKDLELAEYKAKEEQDAVAQREQEARGQMETFDKQFHDQVNQFITDLGFDPKDKGMDWGEDAKTYLEKQGKIQTSIVKSQKALIKKYEDEKAGLEKEIEARIRKKYGLDAIDATTPAGTGGTKTDAQRYAELYPTMAK